MNQDNFYVIYSAGETGKQVADLLLDHNQTVISIFDRNPKESKYRDINIFKLDEWDRLVDLENVVCVLAIHNHYLDPKPN